MLLALAAGTIDYYWRSHDVVARTLLSLVAAGGAGWAWVRFVGPLLRASVTDVAVARQMEATRPEWRDRLSSAVAFLQSGPQDDRFGSSELRQAHIAESAGLMQQLGRRAYLQWSCVLRPLTALLLAGAAFSVVCAWNTESAAFAARRLALPWSRVEWPRRHALFFVDPPSRLAAGQDFEAIVADRRDHVPAAVTLSVWYEGDAEGEIVRMPMRFAGGRMVHRIANVSRPFRYRAEGGDDDTMDWHTLAVVAPPTLQSLDVHVVPPAYSGLPSRNSQGPIRALQGSSVTWTGRMSQNVDEVVLQAEPETLLETAAGNRRAQLTDEGRRFELPPPSGDAWILEQSGKYRLQFATADGIRVPSVSWNVTAVPDQPPVLFVPPVTRGTFATPNAVLPVRAKVSDDLSLQEVVCVCRLGTSESSNEVELYRSAQSQVSLAEDGAPRPDERTLEHALDVGAFKLVPGQFLEVLVRASDFRPQSAASEPQRITIISPEEYEERIVQLQSKFLPLLEQALATQRESRHLSRALQLSAEEGAVTPTRDLDQLRASELQQRRVTQLLVTSPDSLAQQVSAVREEIAVNRLNMLDAQRRLSDISSALEQLAQTPLPAAEARLSEAIQSFPDAATPAYLPAYADRLRRAGEEQQQVLATLESLAAGLAEWEGYRQFAGQVRQLQREQQQLVDQSLEAQRQMLAKNLADLTPAERAELKRLVARQLDLGHRFDRLQTEMRTNQGRLKSSDPLAARTLDDALRIADAAGIRTEMREGASALEQNRIGQAVERQGRAANALDAMLEALSQRGPRDSQRRADMLAEAVRDVAGLQGEQKQIDEQRARAAASGNADELAQNADRQRDLARRTAELSEQVGRLRSPASGHLQEAAREMNQAAEAAAGGQPQQADQAAAQAQQELDEARRMLDQQTARQEQRSRDQYTEQVFNQLETVAAEQDRLLQSTQQVHGEFVQQGGWNAVQERAVRDLARRQSELSTQVESLAARLQELVILQHQLRAIEAAMKQAGLQLAVLDAGEATQKAQRSAAERLAQLQLARQLAQQPPDPASDTSSAPDSEPMTSTDSQQPAARISLEELQLVQIMQRDLARRTAELEEQRQSSPAVEPAAWEKAYEQLSAEQRALAELLTRLLTPAATEGQGSDNAPRR